MIEPTASPDATELRQHLETNHEHVWLSPRCDDERTWSQDDIGPCDDCGEPTIKYVRADIAEADLLALRQEVERLTRERDEALGRTDELEGQAEHVSVEFEKDCWKAMRSLLDQCGFDWSADDAVTADDARTTIHDELEYRHACFERATARAIAAEASLRLATQQREGVVEECAKVADIWSDTRPVLEKSTNPQMTKVIASVTSETAKQIAGHIRALALQPKEN